MKLANTGHQEGHAVVGGRISRPEIEAVTPVIERILLQSKITLEHPVADSFLGSSGSDRFMCGDIDIAVPVETLHFGGKIASHPDVKFCSQHGNVISFIIEIPGGEISPDQLRNGLVQVDLIGGKYEWLRQFYYSDNSSSFKGAHRNLLISAFLAHFRRTAFIEGWDVFAEDEGPIFSQKNGLFIRKRVRVAKGDGSPYASKFITTQSHQSFSLTESATEYFGADFYGAFFCFESLITALEECYDEEIVEATYTRFFADYLKDLPHLNAETFPWSKHPRLDAVRLKLLQS